MPYRSTLTAVVKAKSLRKQLLYPLIWVWTLGMVVAFVLGHHLVHSAGGRAFDSQLEEDVRDLATMVRWADGVPSLDVDRRSLGLLGLDGQGGNRFAVALRGGALLGGDLRVLRLADCEPASAGEPVHFDALLEGAGLHGVCLFVAGPAGAATVQVVITEASGRRQALLRDVLVGELSPLFLLGLATFLMLHWNMRRTMMPLSRLADELALRQPHDLQPLTTTGLPTELEPLRDRLNELFLALDLAARALAHGDIKSWLKKPIAWLDLFVLATLLFPAWLFNFGFLRVLRLWTLIHSEFFWRTVGRRYDDTRVEDVTRAASSLVTLWGQHWLIRNSVSNTTMRYVSASDSVGQLLLKGEGSVGFMSLANFQNLQPAVRDRLRVVAESLPMAGRVYVLNQRHAKRYDEIMAQLRAFAETPEAKQYFNRYNLGGYRALEPRELVALEPYANEVRLTLKQGK